MFVNIAAAASGTSLHELVTRIKIITTLFDRIAIAHTCSGAHRDPNFFYWHMNAGTYRAPTHEG
jgi:hypothetical protein